MFELVIFEIVGILDIKYLSIALSLFFACLQLYRHSSRWFNWRLDLYAMLLLLIILVPCYQFYLFLSGYGKTAHLCDLAKGKHT